MSHTQLKDCGPLDPHYLQRIEETLREALAIHPRLTVIRVDLQLPDNGTYSENLLEHDSPAFFANTEQNLIARFIASLKAQIKADEYAKLKKGTRAHPCELHYVWAREYSHNHRQHYHVALMLNKDRYFSLGHYNYQGSLAWKIKKAWSSALGLNVQNMHTAARFPDNPVYSVNANAPFEVFWGQLCPVLKRLSYLAKEKTKVYGTGQRNFGGSSKKRSGGLAAPIDYWYFSD